MAGTWPKHAAEMLRIDLDAAGIAYRDEEGRVADFHALRHSYITLLSRSGVSPKVAQELARHSDIRLTMQTYTHAGLYDLAAAVESLPPIMPTDREGQRLVLAATGTDGAPGPCLDQNGETLSDCVRTVEAGNGKNEAGASVHQTLQIKAFAIDCDQMTTPEIEATYSRHPAKTLCNFMSIRNPQFATTRC